MKNILILMILLLTVGCVREAPSFPWYSGSFDEAMQLAGSRIVQLEFYTDT